MSSKKWKYDLEGQDLFLKSIYNDLSIIQELSQENSQNKISHLKSLKNLETNSTEEQEHHDDDYLEEILKFHSKYSSDGNENENLFSEGDDVTNPEQQDLFLKAIYNELSIIQEASQESSKELKAEALSKYFETNSTQDQQRNDEEFFDMLFDLKNNQAKKKKIQSENILPEEADDKTNISKYEILQSNLLQLIQNIDQLNYLFH